MPHTDIKGGVSRLSRVMVLVSMASSIPLIEVFYWSYNKTLNIVCHLQDLKYTDD